jgi:hypothetical protein
LLWLRRPAISGCKGLIDIVLYSFQARELEGEWKPTGIGMRAYVIDWLTSLLWWAPLAALIMTSLGLVALKRRSNLPPWLARLTAPPFYLVSLPIATLVAGAEMLGLYCFVVLDLLLHSRVFWFMLYAQFSRAAMFGLVIPLPLFIVFFPNIPVLAFALMFILPIGFWAAIGVSGYLLWRTVWHEDHHQPSPSMARQHLRGLLLLLLFEWAHVLLVTFMFSLIVF